MISFLTEIGNCHMIEQRAHDGYNVFFSKNFRVQVIVLDAEENSKSV